MNKKAVHVLKSSIGVHFDFGKRFPVIFNMMQAWKTGCASITHYMPADRRRKSMKISHRREKVVILMLSIVLVMGMTACSFDANGGTDPGLVATAGTPQETVTPKPEAPTTPETETQQTEAGITETPETTAPDDEGNEYSDAEEIDVGDPIIGIVDKFEDNIIVIKDTDDPDLFYYFSTKDAQVVEGDSPIAVGDRVAISYRGVMGDEEHPGEAVKVSAEAMMYQ